MPTLKDMNYREQEFPDGCNNCIFQNGFTCKLTKNGHYLGTTPDGWTVQLEHEQVYGIGICDEYRKEV